MLEQADMQAAHGSDATEHSTVSGAVSDAVTNGIAAGAALVSTGLHAVAEIAKAGVRGKEESGNASDGEEKDQEEKGQEQEQGKPEEPRLQFGTFDESLAGNILGEAPTGVKAVENGHSSGSVTPAEASSGPSSRAGSVTNLSPVPSQSFSAKPFVPGAAEPRPLEAGAAVKTGSGTLNVNAREFTPGAAPVAATQNGAPAAGAQNGGAADVMWSDVGITDETDSSQDWSQWGYSDQTVWSDEYQEYGTWTLGNDGQYMWYSSQASNWDAAYAGGQYWNGNGYYANGNGRANGGYAANGQAAAADGKTQNGQAAAGGGKRARKDKRREGKPPSLKDIHGAEAVRAASLAVLEQAFPVYSAASLADMLAASKDDLARALDVIARLEAEQAKPAIDGATGEVLVLDEENFPSLSAASSPAKPLSKRAAAAAATVRPASPDTPLHARAEESTPEASRSASPAPAAAAHAYAQPPSPTAADAADAVNGEPSAEVDAEDEKAPEDVAEPTAAGEAAAELAASAEAAAAKPVAAGAAPEAAPAAEAAEASDKDVEQDAAPAPAPVPVPPVAAWGSKEKPAFLTASSGDASGTAAAPAPPADAPKRAVPITQGATAPRKTGRKTGAAGAAGGNATWVATGAAADAQYSEARIVARDHMRLRNQFFQQATQAYLGGDKALAKELGSKGRWHAAQMAAAHADASDAIFQARNPTRGNASGQVAVIDLHGQHVAEALKLLQRELARLRGSFPGSGQNRQPAKSAGRRVQILVGNNSHSKAKHTPMRLPMAVEEFLRSEGFAFKKPLAGALEITA